MFYQELVYYKLRIDYQNYGVGLAGLILRTSFLRGTVSKFRLGTTSQIIYFATRLYRKNTNKHPAVVISDFEL
jgi:hypothetical protein